MDIVGDNYAMAVLKKWLGELGLSTKGTKAELLVRLNAVPAAERGNAPRVDNLEDDHLVAETRRVIQSQQAEMFKGTEALANLYKEIEAAKNVLEQLRMHGRNQELEGDDDTSCQDVEDDAQGNASCEIQRNVAAEKNFGDWASMAFSLAKEILMEYDGNTPVRNWIAQFDNITQLHKLNDMQRQLLCIAKLKGKALQWLHADPVRVVKPINQVLNQLKEAFGGKLPKIELRRKFAGRMWISDENFSVYFEDKCMLARDLDMDDDELLDGIIEGIPHENLRIQAKLQCFDNPAKMRRAFADVALPRQSGLLMKSEAAKGRDIKENSRCFNCNSKGHWARDCSKPKRKPGSCYGCGDEGHLMAQCPKRKVKKEDSVVNNFNAS
ncbi:uncharacterized protein LOC122320112 [Drosophila ficusphila]|uniref:uncharacterized protein LOC122320112 n=1 Tax=Drosophila ficusphila TaxID=30025 RepID=UPI001C8A4D72|nr:uncharacterized protein LOC122320112 [Drosophila ficusphila]